LPCRPDNRSSIAHATPLPSPGVRRMHRAACRTSGSATRRATLALCCIGAVEIAARRRAPTVLAAQDYPAVRAARVRLRPASIQHDGPEFDPDGSLRRFDDLVGASALVRHRENAGCRATDLRSSRSRVPRPLHATRRSPRSCAAGARSSIGRGRPTRAEAHDDTADDGPPSAGVRGSVYRGVRALAAHRDPRRVATTALDVGGLGTFAFKRNRDLQEVRTTTDLSSRGPVDPSGSCGSRETHKTTISRAVPRRGRGGRERDRAWGSFTASRALRAARAAEASDAHRGRRTRRNTSRLLPPEHSLTALGERVVRSRVRRHTARCPRPPLHRSVLARAW
jgi:hypothetical protein